MESANIEDLEDWDEPVQSVQDLVEKGVSHIPLIYIRQVCDRHKIHDEEYGGLLPTIDFSGLKDTQRNESTMRELAMACEEWGFFQLINHGISPSLLARVKDVARKFFDLPLSEKHRSSNSPNSLIGYGSRMGVSKTTILDWGDYFLHYVWPPQDRDMDEIWPDNPLDYRNVMDEYSEEIHKLYKTLMTILSRNLGLKPSYLEKALGGKKASHVLRINYYPPCPQPHLTLGLGSHSDAGAITFLLQDEVLGLQIRKGDQWITVKPIPNAISINIADQLQIISNGRYKSVEHRAIVNQSKPRMTIAIFCNPADDTVISPAPPLLDEEHPSLYRSMTFGEFLASFFKKGLDGKGYIESFKTHNNNK